MWPNPPFLADVVTFTEEILDGKVHFLCSDEKRIEHLFWISHSHEECSFYRILQDFWSQPSNKHFKKVWNKFKAKFNHKNTRIRHWRQCWLWTSISKLGDYLIPPSVVLSLRNEDAYLKRFNKIWNII